MEGSIKKFQECFELIDNPIAGVNPDGGIVFCNFAFRKDFLATQAIQPNNSYPNFQDLHIICKTDILSEISEFNYSNNNFYSIDVNWSGVPYQLKVRTDAKISDNVFLFCFERIDVKNQFSPQIQMEQMEEQLSESEEKYRLIFEKSNDPILILDGETWIDCNESALRMLGYKHKSEIIGKKPSELSPATQEGGSLSAEKAKEMIQIGYSKGYHQFEWTHKKSNGEPLYTEVMLTQIPINHKPVLHTVWRDITARKQLFAERENSVRTLLDANEKKHQALKLLDNSARLASIGVITAGITHEINQPVNAIRIGTEGLLSWNTANGKILPDPIVTLLEGVSTATCRITEIIRHMRGIWIDQSNPGIEKVGINLCVNQAINFAKMRLQSHEIKFVSELSNEELFVDANYLQLELVINNLIANSVFSLDKTDRKNKLIKISTYKVENKVFLSVYDNGDGFDEADGAKLFDPFFSSRHSDGGTGLGLAIVKMFLDRFGAQIKAVRNEEGGATMIINFESTK